MIQLHSMLQKENIGDIGRRGRSEATNAQHGDACWHVDLQVETVTQQT